MTLIRFIVLFVLILDVAAFPFACNCSSKSRSKKVMIDTFTAYEECPKYTDKEGNQKSVFEFSRYDIVYVQNFEVKLNEKFELSKTVLDYTDVSEENPEPTSKTYTITGWKKLKSADPKLGSDTISLPYIYNDSDFLPYYRGARNVIVLIPIVEQVM